MQFTTGMIVTKKPYSEMSSFSWKEIIEDSIKDKLIIRATTSGNIFALKAANVRPGKVYLNFIDTMGPAGTMCRGLIVKAHAVYKKKSNEEMIGSNNNIENMQFLATIKLKLTCILFHG